ncbi:MAG: hypothetical protein ACPGUV_11065, partial [Polyangiales bacterium]
MTAWAGALMAACDPAAAGRAGDKNNPSDAPLTAGILIVLRDQTQAQSKEIRTAAVRYLNHDTQLPFENRDAANNAMLQWLMHLPFEAQLSEAQAADTMDPSSEATLQRRVHAAWRRILRSDPPPEDPDRLGGYPLLIGTVKDNGNTDSNAFVSRRDSESLAHFVRDRLCQDEG